MKPSSGTSNNYQAIRSSCDRCRFQKLKCTIPPGNNGHGPCQRCNRAKVECIFGRRRRASRVGEAKKRTETTAFNEASMATPVTSTSSLNLSCLPLQGAEIEIVPQADPILYDAHDWDSIHLQNIMEKTTNATNDVGGLYLQPGDRLDGAFLFDTAMSEATQSSPSDASPYQSTTNINDTSENSNLIQRLLALLLEMQQRLQMLRAGSWQFGSVCGLDDYPIGTVLHISQQLSALVGPLLNQARETCNTTVSQTGPDSDAIIVDTQATLLVLSSYMCLTRIYSVVLKHFETHLTHMPKHGHTLADRNTSPTLQLGDLPRAKITHDLSQIHAALHMLQDSLSGIEGQLGRGGVVARDTVLGLLRKEAMLSSSAHSHAEEGLTMQASAVKGLLRERMSL